MPVALPQSSWTRATADQLLFRAAFGGTPAEREAFYVLGRDQGIGAAVDSLLDAPFSPAAIPFPTWIETQADPNGDNSGLSRAVRFAEVVHWFLRHCTGTSPLGGRMLAFWVDHFPIDEATIDSTTDFLYFYRHFHVLRTHALGNFGSLVRAVSWSEGMMRMLDLYRSQRGNVNENFARELMELFTLGVDGGYTEQDVSTLAAVFTGRRLRADTNNVAGSGWPYTPYSTSSLVDTTAKSFLGTTIPAHVTSANNPDQGERAIDIILGRVACAQHTCWKLWRYFVSPTPPADVLQDLALRFKDTHGYAIKPLLRDLFTSAAFYDPAHRGHMIKAPVDLLVSSCRVLGAPLPPRGIAQMILNDLGMAVTLPPSIEGWPEPDGVGNGWLSGALTLTRLNLPNLLVHGDKTVLSNPTASQVSTETVVLPDLAAIAPVTLRGADAFPRLLEHLRHRFLPFHALRPAQVRTLAATYRANLDRVGEEGAVRDLLRLLMALPEFQLH